MKDFDAKIKVIAKSEEMHLPNGFLERNNNLLANLAITNKKTKFTFGTIKLQYRFLTAFMISLIFIGSISVAANSLSGGDFFSQFYMRITSIRNDLNYNHMNTSQLKDISSSVVGNVIDSEEIKIDIMDVVSSGNAINIMLRITAKELDSVLYDNHVPPLMNYRFYDEESNLDSYLVGGGTGYYYYDQDVSLAPNQIKIILSYIGKDPFAEEECFIRFDKFGYYSDDLVFQTLYDTSWLINIPLDAQEDYSKEIFIDQQVAVNDEFIYFNNVQITPFSCSFNLQVDAKHNDELYSQYANKVSEIKINLKDGTTLDHNYFTWTCGTNDYNRQYEAILKFTVPITVEDVLSINAFGIECIIQ